MKRHWHCPQNTRSLRITYLKKYKQIPMTRKKLVHWWRELKSSPQFLTPDLFLLDCPFTHKHWRLRSSSTFSLYPQISIARESNSMSSHRPLKWKKKTQETLTAKKDARKSPSNLWKRQIGCWCSVDSVGKNFFFLKHLGITFKNTIFKNNKLICTSWHLEQVAL